MSRSADRHNAALRPILAATLNWIGPRPVDLLVFAETFVVGLFLTIVRLGGDEPVLDVFAEGVRKRLAEVRLGELDPPGQA